MHNRGVMSLSFTVLHPRVKQRGAGQAKASHLGEGGDQGELEEANTQEMEGNKWSKQQRKNGKSWLLFKDQTRRVNEGAVGRAEKGKGWPCLWPAMHLMEAQKRGGQTWHHTTLLQFNQWPSLLFLIFLSLLSYLSLLSRKRRCQVLQALNGATCSWMRFHSGWEALKNLISRFLSFYRRERIRKKK